MKLLKSGIIVLLLFIGCRTTNQPTQQLVTIKYCSDPMYTFEVVGTNLKGFGLEQLIDVLRKFKSENPDAEYELFAEIKCVTEKEQAIKKSIRDAGITLKL